MVKNILWDFDGVILDSMPIRDWGFREIFKNFDKKDVDALLVYHNLNSGLSRYVKIRYFYEKILGKEISDDKVLEYAGNFSTLMKQELTNMANLIQDSVSFIKDNFKKYKFHLVSGSDQTELRFLCEKLGISQYFLSIHGSPIPKKELVSNLLKQENYQITETCLIGDSINDKEAAEHNDITFIGYNNLALNNNLYISSFKESKIFE